MKKRITLACLIAVLICLLTAVSGCVNREPEQPPRPTPYRPPADQFTFPQPEKYPLQDEYIADRTAFVVFNRSTEPRTKYVPLQEIMDYQTQYPDCNSTWFRSQLSGEDLCIYNAYLYGMEHGYIYFELFVEDGDKDFSYIREAVSLDSPFLQQNINRYGERIYEQAPHYLGDRITVNMDQFSLDGLERKKALLDICRQIVADMPQTCVTQWEKAEYLYRYVCDHLEYVDYEDMSNGDYLYDAVTAGKTLCDGYSNMLSLLFNLAGIESCEAMGYKVQDLSGVTREQAGGHTWVVAKLDGKYYNFDPTWEDTKGGQWGSSLLYFGFSDRLAPVKYLRCEGMRPKCTDTSRDFCYADLVVPNITDTKNIKAMGQAVQLRFGEGQTVTLVAVTNGFTEKDRRKFNEKFWRYLGKIKEVKLTAMVQETHALLWLTAED